MLALHCWLAGLATPQGVQPVSQFSLSEAATEPFLPPRSALVQSDNLKRLLPDPR